MVGVNKPNLTNTGGGKVGKPIISTPGTGLIQSGDGPDPTYVSITCPSSTGEENRKEMSLGETKIQTSDTLKP